MTSESSSSSSSSYSFSSPNPLLIWGCISISFQLFRVSMDLIQTASQKTSADFKEDHHNFKNNNKTDKQAQPQAPNETKTATETDSLLFFSKSNNNNNSRGFFNNNDNNNNNAITKSSSWSFRLQSLLAIIMLLTVLGMNIRTHKVHSLMGTGIMISSMVVFAVGAFITYRDPYRKRFGMISRTLLLGTTMTLIVPIAIRYYTHRTETSSADESLWTCVAVYTLLVLVEIVFIDQYQNNEVDNGGGGGGAISRSFGSIGGGSSSTGSTTSSTGGGFPTKKTLSKSAIITLLKPYFWPDETDESGRHTNRIRAIGTWVCVFFSKVCNLSSPLFLGWASTALAHQDYTACIWYSILYSMIQFLGAALKECQSLVYLKVAQAAFCQLSETAFVHLHNLSLDWHLQKKLGEVLRSMDRGIAACDTLMKYLFLWLLPGLSECLIVCIIFATYFHYFPLAVAVFYFVWLYIVWTILVTLWRKKFRKAVVKSDNDWHDRCTDSLLNFETVKHFTAEEYERQRFAESVQNYQTGSVHVQASLSFLNITQKFILSVCLATALAFSAMGIQERINCCVEQFDCPETAINECCHTTEALKTCRGMQVGDFVAVLTYTIQLFAPLNFLGSVYNAIVMAVIDLTNLSELLAEHPDVVDSPDAIPLPLSRPKRGKKKKPTTKILSKSDNDNNNDFNNGEDMDTVVLQEGDEDNDGNEKTKEMEESEEDEEEDVDEDDIAVEFDNVYFHYPTQSSKQGLKGVSFKMKRGTTTAIVGPTGAGKTTISRLFFRFYDVLSGSIKVNGQDVRAVTQSSLRAAIGVVPQNASMFNDTLKANLLYGRRNATQEELEQAAQDAQLLTFIESLDLKWETMVGDRGLKLSGGEKQRAAIARCLLKDPPFVLLDEATSALDTLTEKSVQQALDRLGNHRTVLVIAHRLGTIRNADNILVLKDGVVAEQGTHDELLQIPNGIYAEMWNMQLHSTTTTTASTSSLGVGIGSGANPFDDDDANVATTTKANETETTTTTTTTTSE